MSTVDTILRKNALTFQEINVLKAEYLEARHARDVAQQRNVLFSAFLILVLAAFAGMFWFMHNKQELHGINGKCSAMNRLEAHGLHAEDTSV